MDEKETITELGEGKTLSIPTTFWRVEEIADWEGELEPQYFKGKDLPEFILKSYVEEGTVIEMERGKGSEVFLWPLEKN